MINYTKIQIRYFQRFCDLWQVYFHGKISPIVRNFQIIPSLVKFLLCLDQTSRNIRFLQKYITPCRKLQKFLMNYQKKSISVYFISGKFHDFLTSFDQSKIMQDHFCSYWTSRNISLFQKSVTPCTELQKLHFSYQNKYISVFYIYGDFHDFWTSFDWSKISCKSYASRNLKTGRFCNLYNFHLLLPKITFHLILTPFFILNPLVTSKSWKLLYSLEFWFRPKHDPKTRKASFHKVMIFSLGLS